VNSVSKQMRKRNNSDQFWATMTWKLYFMLLLILLIAYAFSLWLKCSFSQNFLLLFSSLFLRMLF